MGSRKHLAVPIPSRSWLWIAAAILFGVTAGTACYFAIQMKFVAGYDDALDVGITSSTKK